MALSNVLISEFVKVTNDDKKVHTGATVYGTAKEYDGEMYVQLDGSDLLTPIETTATVKDGERVTVTVKDHTATVNGNLTDPSASNGDVQSVQKDVSELSGEVTELDVLVANTIQANEARFDELIAGNATITGKLEAAEANIETLVAGNATITGKLEAAEANIETLVAGNATITGKLEAAEANITELVAEDVAITGRLDAQDAYIHDLEATNGEFKNLTTEKFEALDAIIDDLDARIIDTESLEAEYANIDFANIGELAIQNFFAKSGMVDDLVISDGHVTGTLVGVTIKGDLIEGGTIVADKLVIQGDDGLYYKLNTDGETVTSQQTEYNSLSGTIITAKSITAEKIRVDDLVAFGATIGGFHITDASLYSGVKTTVDNTTRGIYLDAEGQAAFGDANNYVKYYRNQNGTYSLDISASDITLGSSNKSVGEELDNLQNELDNMDIGGRNLIRNSSTMIFEDYYFYESTEPNPEPTESFDVSYDDNGTVIITKTSIVASSDGKGVVTLTGVTASDDGYNTVTLSR